MSDQYVQMLVHSYPTEKSLGKFARDIALLSARHMALNIEHPAVQEWLSGPFTKSVRRVKEGAKMDRVANEEGVSPSLLGMAAMPQPYLDMPKALASTQLFKEDLAPQDHLPDCPELTIVVNSELGMSSGKMAAQVAHGLCSWVLSNELVVPRDFNVLLVTAEDFQAIPAEEALVRIVDNGLTELDGPTATVIVTDEV